MSDFIFDCYPGSKGRDRYGLDDGGNYDSLIEPFVGGGRFLFKMLRKYPGIKYAFIADSDPTVRVPYEVWLKPELHEQVYFHLRQLSVKFRRYARAYAIALLSLFGWRSFNFLLSLMDTLINAIRQALKGKVWQKLKAEFDEVYVNAYYKEHLFKSKKSSSDVNNSS